ncbi:MAG: formyl-CoA transferase [Betaproteobacteria bacterium RIFCSPLOWO2_12_FULL_64_23]|nr:MAG: formyl-CoA transferase [Betaproteobacteria bacterium RIFCSPLOWO2_12_FULL_64_23]
MSAKKPLEGIKVIELGQLIAGPFAGKLFAEFGAEVIKIEAPAADGQPGGDPLRQWRKLHNGTSLWWYVQARNKKSVTINLRLAEGQEIVRRLARDADILIENFRPGTMEKWGLGYDRLAAENPGLIMLRLSGFGQTGPYRDQAGFGAIGESMGGLRYLTGYPDRAPVRPNLSIGDSLASLHGVIGAMMALHHRNMNGGRISGKGQVVDVALYEAVFSMLESTLPEFDMYGIVRERSGSNLSGIVPSNTYLTKDGEHVLIAANGDSIFKRLCAAMGRGDLGGDPALADNAGRAKRAGELDAAIGDWAAGYDAAALLALLDQAQVPNGKIYSIADIARDPQYLAREMIRQFTLEDGTPLKLPGIVPKLSDTPGDVNWVGPELGAHTEEVLRAHGYDAAAIAELRHNKAI